MDNILIKNIISQLQDIQDKETWVGENFREKLKGLTEEQAFERPHPEIHSVAELVSHIMVWRIESIRKLRGQKSELTVNSPEDWKKNDELRQIGWQKLKTDFFASQVELIKCIDNRPDKYLENNYLDGYSFKFLLEGLIHHDMYHLGQIGITVKLLKLKDA